MRHPVGALHLDEYGAMANHCWGSIPDHFPSVELDEFVLMSNHIHGIAVIVDEQCNVGEGNMLG